MRPIITRSPKRKEPRQAIVLPRLRDSGCRGGHPPRVVWPGCGEIHTMGFNKRKMKAQLAAAAEKEAAAKRAIEAQEL